MNCNGSPTAWSNLSRSWSKTFSTRRENHPDMSLQKTSKARLRARRGWVGSSVDARMGRIVVPISVPFGLSDRMRRVMNPGYGVDSVV